MLTSQSSILTPKRLSQHVRSTICRRLTGRGHARCDVSVATRLGATREHVQATFRCRGWFYVFFIGARFPLTSIWALSVDSSSGVTTADVTMDMKLRFDVSTFAAVVVGELLNMAWNYDKLLLPKDLCRTGGYTASSFVVNLALAFVLQGIDNYNAHPISNWMDVLAVSLWVVGLYGFLECTENWNVPYTKVFLHGCHKFVIVVCMLTSMVVWREVVIFPYGDSFMDLIP
ncbi:hypothetical protein LSAT2_006137 [Lamellibrachia satsuma]|nr:hypothetical protein LSAT2_006137 [Lamellibrachia satsuma]